MTLMHNEKSGRVESSHGFGRRCSACTADGALADRQPVFFDKIAYYSVDHTRRQYEDDHLKETFVVISTSMKLSGSNKLHGTTMK